MQNIPLPLTGGVLVIPGHVVWNDVAGELVLFNSDDGTYHALNAVASGLWRSIASGAPLADLVASLCRAHRQDAAVIETDVRLFIERALDQDLLRRDATAR